MTPTQEKTLLITVIKKLDQPGTVITTVLANRFFLPLLWVALVIVFTLLFQVASLELLSELILIAIAGLVGTLVGWTFFYIAALKQWLVVRQHIDRARIERRLGELGT